MSAVLFPAAKKSVIDSNITLVVAMSLGRSDWLEVVTGDVRLDSWEEKEPPIKKHDNTHSEISLERAEIS